TFEALPLEVREMLAMARRAAGQPATDLADDLRDAAGRDSQFGRDVLLTFAEGFDAAVDFLITPARGAVGLVGAVVGGGEGLGDEKGSGHGCSFRLQIADCRLRFG